MFCFVFRLYVGIREVCNGILRVADGTTAKMIVSINRGRHVKCRLHYLKEACIG